MPRASGLLLFLGVLCGAGCAQAPVAATPPAAEAPPVDRTYRLLGEIPVGGEGGWDLLAIDEAARRLYVTHATAVVVIDIDGRKVVGEIPDTPGVHGFAVAPALRRGFSSNGKESKSSIVDLATLGTIAKVGTGENPDAMLYEPGRSEVWAFNGRGKSATVLDAATGAVVATVALPGKPELADCDPEGGRVYCNLEDRNAVVAIDAKTHAVVNEWPLAPGEEPTGIAIDAARKRLFVCCHNGLMVMMDSSDGRVIATAPIGQGVDGAAFDPGTGLAFSSNGEGTVTIAREEGPGTLTVVQTLATERGARTMALDPRTHRIYLPSAKFEPAPEQAPGAPRQRPKMIPGTFKVLVYGMGE